MTEEQSIAPKRTLFKLIILFVLFISLIFIYAVYVGPNGLRIKEYRIESSILSENFNGIKIVHFSDLLFRNTDDKDIITNLVDNINKLKPDLVFFTGDLINSDTKITSDNLEFLVSKLKEIDATIAKYYIYGDFDYSFDGYEELMNECGFILLNNSYDEIYYKSNDPLYVVGLPSSIKIATKLDEAFEFYSDEDRKYIITLVHDGKTIKSIDNSDYEVDLILGGHSLNGNVVIPYVGGLFIDDNCYKYYKPEYEKGITKIFISSGLGTNKYRFRMFNKPSFNLYRLKAQS